MRSHFWEDQPHEYTLTTSKYTNCMVCQCISYYRGRTTVWPVLHIFKCRYRNIANHRDHRGGLIRLSGAEISPKARCNPPKRCPKFQSNPEKWWYMSPCLNLLRNYNKKMTPLVISELNGGFSGKSIELNGGFTMGFSSLPCLTKSKRVALGASANGPIVGHYIHVLHPADGDRT